MINWDDVWPDQITPSERTDNIALILWEHRTDNPLAFLVTFDFDERLERDVVLSSLFSGTPYGEKDTFGLRA